MVIVIDALDECKDEEPASAILSVLGRLAERIPKVKFLITGRPEPRIRTGFRLPILVDLTSVFVLHDVDPPLINNDIRLFLKHELSELAQRRQLGVRNFLFLTCPTRTRTSRLPQTMPQTITTAISTIPRETTAFLIIPTTTFPSQTANH